MRSVNPAAAARRVPSAARGLLLALLAGALLVPPVTAKAGEDFIERFGGTWSGDGEVLRKEDMSTRKISCRVENKRIETTSESNGQCRAMVIFTREVASEITVREDGTFSGIYRGADTGPATLEGSLEGDTLELQMTYAQPVFGDDKAVMRITNADDGTYSVAVFDQVDGDGDLEEVSRIEFRRVGD